MTTNHQPPRICSLRALARDLGINHSSLSAAVHDGRLTRGVRIDDRGRVMVTDADAASEDWHSVHAPQILEVARAADQAKEVARRLAAKRPDAIVLTDVALDREVTAAELFAERNALSLLVTALTLDALADRSAAQLKRRVSPRLREAAPCHGAKAADLALAWDEFGSALQMAAEMNDEKA